MVIFKSGSWLGFTFNYTKRMNDLVVKTTIYVQWAEKKYEKQYIL